MSKQRPWRKFYPQDWMSDHLLRQCSASTRGIWIDMLCIAWNSPVEGYFVNPDGSAMTHGQIAKIIGEPPGLVHRALDQLEETGTISRGQDDILYSRRVARDAESLRVARDFGKMGGNPTLMGVDKSPDKAGVSEMPLPSSVSVSDSASLSSGRGSAEGETGPSFLAFWQAYPPKRRTRQADCIAEWSDAIAQGADPVEIVAAAHEYAGSRVAQTNGCLSAVNWLRGRCWADSREAWDVVFGDDDNGKPRRDYKALAEGDGW